MQKKDNILWKLFALSWVLLVASCQSDEGLPFEEGGTSLRLTIRCAENSKTTRGVEDLDDDGTVTDEEMYVDGQKMYRLAVFILENNTVVASTVLETGDSRFAGDNKEATVSFGNLDYSKNYTVYAVANYGDYAGLTGNLQGLDESNVAGGLDVRASSDNICSSRTPYPLTMTKNVSLMPGTNNISGELTRTFARIRVNVRNQSAMNDLYITDFSFSQKFTQSSADLFEEGGTADVSPVVTSEDAVTPFVENMMIAKISDDGKVNETTIFDTYLLESTGGDYNYTLGLKYDGGTKEEYRVSDTPVRDSDDIEDGAMYVMYNTQSGRYLYANGNSVGAGSAYQTNGELNHNYVWRFNNTSGDRYTIESMGATGYFMQSSAVSSDRVPLSVNPGSSDYFSASTNDDYIRLQSTRYNYYIYVNGSTVSGNRATSSTQRRRTYFYLYKVEKVQVSADIEHNETIPVRVVDKVTGEALPLTAIRRNDFIEILVNVTYNEKSGDVEFEVSGWDDVNGEITFD